MVSAVCNTAEVAALSFSYSSFDQCSDSIKLYGEVSCMNSGIQLTGFGYYVIGQARYFKPMHLWDATTGDVASFTTTFTFDIISNVDSNKNGSMGPRRAVTVWHSSWHRKTTASQWVGEPAEAVWFCVYRRFCWRQNADKSPLADRELDQCRSEIHPTSSQSLIYGSEGYLAPEVLETGKSTKSSDVFSFGVVALQIVSGKSAYVINNSAQRRHIVEWAWGLYGEGHVEAVVDPKLNGVFVEEQVRRLLEVGLHCAHPDPSRWPRMKDAMDAMNFRDPLALAPLPLQYPTNRSSQAGLLPSLSRILEESPTVSSLQQPVLSSSGVVPPPHDQPVASIARARAAVSRLHRTV
ncbi:unnamed protein product [Linum tenue]|uniref:Protein kinase domain-containing protein n=1 Tax=Linum tenue TaxID=586396 RepID=A0AAV0QY68_9ROSI|nr:unnamed protein product [Linum tenue]